MGSGTSGAAVPNGPQTDPIIFTALKSEYLRLKAIGIPDEELFEQMKTFYESLIISSSNNKITSKIVPTGTLLSPLEIGKLFLAKQTCPSEAIEGVVGRFTRGRSPQDFLRLSDEPRLFTFIASSQLLHGCLGKNAAEAMIFLGFSISWLQNRLHDDPPTIFKLFLFPKISAFPATWDNLFELIKEGYGDDLYMKLFPFKEQLKTESYDSIDPEYKLKAISELPVDEKYAHIDFLTPERFLALSEINLYYARGFFYHTMSCNLHYTGTGLSPTGVEEWITKNVNIEEIDGLQVVDLTVAQEDLAEIATSTPKNSEAKRRLSIK